MPYMPPVSLWAVLDDMRRRLLADITADEAALRAAESPATVDPPDITPTPPVGAGHGALSARERGTWQSPAIPPADWDRIRRSAGVAKTVLPLALGRLVASDIDAWCRSGGLYGGHRERLAVADELDAMAHTLATDRTYG